MKKGTIIIVVLLFIVIGILLYAFRDKIFKGKGKNDDDVVVHPEDIGCDPSKCDPDRIGYNDCGEQWYPCG